MIIYEREVILTDASLFVFLESLPQIPLISQIFSAKLRDLRKIKLSGMDENQISYKIRGAVFNVYNHFGPGLLESVYIAALQTDLQKEGLSVKKEVPVPVFYKDQKLEVGFRLDLLVEDKVIIEVKSVETLAEVHHKQVITYLKLTNKKLAILVNFNVEKIDSGIFRKVNGL